MLTTLDHLKRAWQTLDVSQRAVALAKAAAANTVDRGAAEYLVSCAQAVYMRNESRWYYWLAKADDETKVPTPPPFSDQLETDVRVGPDLT